MQMYDSLTPRSLGYIREQTRNIHIHENGLVFWWCPEAFHSWIDSFGNSDWVGVQSLKKWKVRSNGKSWRDPMVEQERLNTHFKDDKLMTLESQLATLEHWFLGPVLHTTPRVLTRTFSGLESIPKTEQDARMSKRHGSSFFADLKTPHRLR